MMSHSPAALGVHMGGTSSCVMQVELSIRCRNLLCTDVLSKSDPMVILYMLQNKQWMEKGRTEQIQNNLNPEFSKKIKLDYYFEESQKIKFEVYDIDNTSATLADDDFLGLAETTLGQVVSSCVLSLNLYNQNGSKAGKGTITITAEEVDDNNREVLLLSFKATKLEDKRWFSSTNPFLELHKASPTGDWILSHRTEACKGNLNPVWKSFEVRQQNLGGVNIEAPILIICYDHRSSGNHELIGETKVTLGDLLEAQHQPKSWPCLNTKKKKDSGTIVLTSCKVNKSHSFLDYVFGGTQINLTVAIDFTASNGDPRTPNSLHFMNPSYPNEYASAILSVGNVVQDYDSDKMFPALGFGAKIPPNYQVSHEFALNFDMANPFCSGVGGLITAYQNCLMQVQLYGPTNFSPVINHVAKFAEQAHQQNNCENYFILLILTDGVVTDMGETCKAIVRASHLPLSIIIVGVGKADFSNMVTLDGDGDLLRAPDGTKAFRDIVQFVPYNQFRTDPELLAKEVLAEIPSQLTNYYRLLNIPPKPGRHNVNIPVL